MPNTNKYRLIIAALGIVVVALVIILLTKSQNGPAPTDLSANNTTMTQTSSAPVVNSGNPGSQAASTTVKPKPYVPPATGFTIHLLTPISGETWTISDQNIISWDRAAGVTGHIDLLDATTKALVGVILPQTGPQQTSYSWNGRFLQISRTSPSKTSAVPGTYVVRVSFDGNNLASITSGPVTIVAGPPANQ